MTLPSPEFSSPYTPRTDVVASQKREEAIVVRARFESIWIDGDLNKFGHRWIVWPVVLGEGSLRWSALNTRVLDPAEMGGPSAAGLCFRVNSGWPKSDTRVSDPAFLPSPLRKLAEGAHVPAVDERCRSARLPFWLALRALREPVPPPADFSASGDLVQEGTTLRVGHVEDVPEKLLACASMCAERRLEKHCLLLPAENRHQVEPEALKKLLDDHRSFGSSTWKIETHETEGDVLELGMQVAGCPVRLTVRFVNDTNQAIQAVGWAPAPAQRRWLPTATAAAGTAAVAVAAMLVNWAPPAHEALPTPPEPGPPAKVDTPPKGEEPGAGTPQGDDATQRAGAGASHGRDVAPDLATARPSEETATSPDPPKAARSGVSSASIVGTAAAPESPAAQVEPAGNVHCTGDAQVCGWIRNQAAGLPVTVRVSAGEIRDDASNGASYLSRFSLRVGDRDCPDTSPTLHTPGKPLEDRITATLRDCLDGVE